LATEKLPGDDRHAMAQPPWLSAQDAYREVNSSPPPPQLAADRGDHHAADPAWADAPTDEFAPIPAVPPGQFADTPRHWPPVPPRPALQSEQPDDRHVTGRHWRAYDHREINQAESHAQRPADRRGNVESASVRNGTDHRLSNPEINDGTGQLGRQAASAADLKPDEIGVAEARRGGAAATAEPIESTAETTPAHRNPLPPSMVRATPMHAELDRLSANPDEPLPAQPAATPTRDATAALPQPSQGSAIAPEMSLPLPLLPGGYPPGAVAAPFWWPPTAPHLWPPFPPGAPPPSDWQHPMGDAAQSPAASTHPAALPIRTFRMPPSLDEAKVVDHRKSAPRSGWRRLVHRATRGHLNPGDSRKDRAHQHLIGRVRQPLANDFRIAVLSIKGGVGKSTTTLGLGSALATIRPDRVIAIDANPDRGTLAERVHDASTSSTVRDLLTHPNIGRYADIRSHTRMAVSRLEVLASEQDPAAAEVFDEADYRRALDILGHYYNIILTDCGTGIMHSAMTGVLDLAHTIVLVSSPAIDAVQSASATLDWLMQHGHSELVRGCHVVLSAARPGSAAVKLDKVYEFFETRCRSIHFVPFDPHLAAGAEVDFAMLKPATHRAYLGLADAVAEQFPQVLADPDNA
jgi:MinD-like ATPase involved in chromosome partitioning or flagellar assembly